MKRWFAMSGVVGVLLSVACNEPASPVGPSAVRPPSLALDAAGAGSGSQAASAAHATRVVPFTGRFEGSQTVTPLTPPLASVEVSATGNATHLGRFTIDLPHTVNFATRTAEGTCTIVAANGDRLIATFTGQAQVGPIVSIVEQATITGGTGRFATASGSFTIRRQFDPVAGTTSGSFEGTLSVPRDGAE